MIPVCGLGCCLGYFFVKIYYYSDTLPVDEANQPVCPLISCLYRCFAGEKQEKLEEVTLQWSIVCSCFGALVAPSVRVGCNAAEIFVKTDIGDVMGNLLFDRAIDARTDTERSE